MKKAMYVAILLIPVFGFCQDNVSSKSNTPIETVIVKKKVAAVDVNQKKVIVKNDVVLVKQNTPVENKIINYIGTPNTTYIEPKPLVKIEKL